MTTKKQRTPPRANRNTLTPAQPAAATVPGKSSTLGVYERLRRAIMDFELAPGARVTETELADAFGISRTPVREALHRLETEGLISIRPKQGCFVRGVDIHQISNYYDVRIALEVMAVELACKNMPDEVIARMLETWNPATRPKRFKNSDEIKVLEEVFHMMIAEYSGNPVLAGYLKDVNDNIRSVRRLGFPDAKSIVETYEEHYRICELLKKRDARAAREEMIRHIRKSQGIARSVTLNQLQQQYHRSGALRFS